MQHVILVTKRCLFGGCLLEWAPVHAIGPVPGPISETYRRFLAGWVGGQVPRVRVPLLVRGRPARFSTVSLLTVGKGVGGCVPSRVVVRERRPLVNAEEISSLLLDGGDPFRVRGVVAFRNGRGERRVSWWVHRGELGVLRERAGRLGSSVSGVVRGWWLDGLPLLVDASVLSETPGGWTVYVHHLPRFLPRARGTPRSEWVEWPLPEGVLDLETVSPGG